MNILHQLEKKMLQWAKGLQHLPKGGRRWLGQNIWWIILIIVCISALQAFFGILGLFGQLSALGTLQQHYLVNPVVQTWAIVTFSVSLFFSIIVTVLQALAIQPLRERIKKGWVLLFASWVVSVIALGVNAVLTLNVIGFILTILFGAIFMAVYGYILFEIHGEFAHTTKARKAKKA